MKVYILEFTQSAPDNQYNAVFSLHRTLEGALKAGDAAIAEAYTEDSVDHLDEYIFSDWEKINSVYRRRASNYDNDTFWITPMELQN